MPSMSGLELIRSAREMRARWSAVIISGYADANDIAKRPRNVPLLSKPFTMSELLDALDTALAGR